MVKITKSVLGTIKKLKQKKYRMAEGCFLVEGRKVVLDFLSAGYQPKWMLATPSFRQRHATLLQPHAKNVFEVTADLLASLGNLKTNRDVLMVVLIPVRSVPVMDATSRVLVLDNVGDPGNLGTMLRIADWYGLQGVVASQTTVDCYHPKVVQASMGSLARVQVDYVDLSAWLNKAYTQGQHIIGGVLHGGVSLRKKPLPTSGLLVIGSESDGISDELMPFLTHKVTIPGYGGASSLNAAVACGIICDYWVAGP